jgi:hypothetical protein
MAAPEGNKNATKNKFWSDALRKYVTQNPESLERAAKALLLKAEDGDVAAMKELGDRLEGKAAQSVTVSGDEDAPLVTKVIREIVRPKDSNG